MALAIQEKMPQAALKIAMRFAAMAYAKLMSQGAVVIVHLNVAMECVVRTGAKMFVLALLIVPEAVPAFWQEPPFLWQMAL
jgi:hypothetical protein